MKMYEVGGCVRDEILGLKSKDIDFSVVLDKNDLIVNSTILSDDHDPFVIMVNELKDRGFTIFVETPDFFVAKGKFPKDEKYAQYAGLVADFVLARKESTYTDGRRPDVVEVGTLYDDLSRRDFTMNAIAKDGDSYIDPFDGIKHIQERVIYAVGDPNVRLQEDALRALRALRFSVTKGFHIAEGLAFAMETVSVLDALGRISPDRRKEELSKMFRFDTLESLEALRRFPALTRAVLSDRVSLDATLKTKNRGK